MLNDDILRRMIGVKVWKTVFYVFFRLCGHSSTGATILSDFFL